MGGVAAGATTPLVLSGDHGDKAAPDTLIELARTEVRGVFARVRGKQSRVHGQYQHITMSRKG